jgi:hypothetical protein
VTQQPDRHDPYRSCQLDVEGPDAGKLTEQAIRQAAVFLVESEADLYAAHVGMAHPVARSKYRPHLGVEGAITRWRATITVRLLPHIVEERRKTAKRDKPPDKTRSRGLHVVPFDAS